MDTPFIFAIGIDLPDREFASLAAAARHIVALRAKAPLVDGQPPELGAVAGVLARSDLPGGRMVTVRLRDGSALGQVLGYLLMPIKEAVAHLAAPTVMAAILTAQDALDARAAA